MRGDDHALSKNDGESRTHHHSSCRLSYSLTFHSILSAVYISLDLYFRLLILSSKHQNINSSPLPPTMQTSRFTSRASALLTQRTAMPFSRTFASSSAIMQRVSDLIKHDHDELRTYKDNILNAKDVDEKVRWQNQFTWELARHSIAEELVVYPAMEKNW